MKKSIHKINVRTIRNLSENDGLTLKNGKKISYLSGWQVAVRGDVCYTPRGNNEVYSRVQCPIKRQ